MNLYPQYTRLVIPPATPPIRLVFNDEEIPAPEAVGLDTGLACDMVIPIVHLPDLIAPDIIASSVPERFNGWGGAVKDARSFDAQLILHHSTWLFDVRVVFSSEFREWYIGLPLLRHFDLLLAETDPSRPCLSGREILP